MLYEPTTNTVKELQEAGHLHGLKPEAVKILDFFMQYEGLRASTSSLATRLNMSASDACKNLNALVDKKLVVPATNANRFPDTQIQFTYDANYARIKELRSNALIEASTG